MKPRTLFNFLIAQTKTSLETNRTHILASVMLFELPLDYIIYF